MADIKSHYDQFLAPIYAWMTGDFAKNVATEEAYLTKVLKNTRPSAKALDLGCAHGIHSVALAKLGYQVESLDTCAVLLEELKKNKGTMAIKPLAKDMKTYRPLQPVDVAVCMGDTLSHLTSNEEVTAFAAHLHTIIKPGGQLVLSFRDFTADLKGTSRAVLVRSDDQRIFDCFLQFSSAAIDVTDMYHVRTSAGWALTTSSYKKLRLSADGVIKTFKEVGFSLVAQESTEGMIRIVLRS